VTRARGAIYTPWARFEYERCHPVDPADFERITALVNGEPRRQTWTPIAMQFFRDKNARHRRESDSPWLGPHALIFRPRAIEALGPLLDQYGELLPLLCRGAEVWMYNPIRVLDALDEQASAVARFSSGRIMVVDRYVFRPDVVRDVAIFKLPNLRAGPALVGDEFVERWEAAGLTGLDFEEVWRPS
jgi:hypothetical protein